MLELPPVDINKLVLVIQTAYPAQGVQYSLGASKKMKQKHQMQKQQVARIVTL